MFKQAITPITIAVSVAIAGCATHMQNPLDRVTYRDEPLVRDVQPGMTQQQVLTIGGEPSDAGARIAAPGLCHEYVLYHDGKETPYFVSFDAAGHVDGKGFLTCAQMEDNQRDQ